MVTGKLVKDIMVDISNYPHVSSSSQLKHAISVFKNSVLEGANCIKPIIALVLDDKSLVGTLRLRDILRGLEPNFLKSPLNTEGYDGDSADLALIWDALFDGESKRLAERPIREVMRPVAMFIGPDDPVAKAACIMIRNDLLVLPVLENGKKLVGLVRMLEIFDVLASATIDDASNNVVTLKARA